MDDKLITTQNVDLTEEINFLISIVEKRKAEIAFLELRTLCQYIANTFGEEGRAMCHNLSRFSEGYLESSYNVLYDKLLSYTEEKDQSINREFVWNVMTNLQIPVKKPKDFIEFESITKKINGNDWLFSDETDIVNVTLSSDELIRKHKDYSVNFVLEPLIFENGNNIIGAERGTGKTRFCLSLAFAMVYGMKNFMGYKLKSSGDVLFLNFEIHEPQFKLIVEPVENYYKKQGAKKNEFYSLSYLSYLELSIQDIRRTIEVHMPKLVIVDSFKAFAPHILAEKEFNNLNIKLVYNVLNGWIKDFDVTVIITNHTNKGTRGNKSDSDLMFGPGALMDFADHTFLLRKTTEPNTRLLVPDKCRYAREDQATTNLIEIVGNETNDELWFEMIEEDVEESDYLPTTNKPSNKKYDKDDEYFIMSLHDDGKSIREIAEETGISKSTVSRIINNNKKTTPEDNLPF